MSPQPQPNPVPPGPDEHTTELSPRRLPPASRALSEARTPSWLSFGLPRLLAWTLALTLLTGALPWQQTASTTGTVIIWGTQDRPQALDAPINGIIKKWNVLEGDYVEAGDVIAELVDNDPAFASRLEQDRILAEAGYDAARIRTQAAEGRLSATLQLRDASVAGARARVESAEQRLRGARELAGAAKVEYETQRMQTERIIDLAAEGARSTRDVELANYQLQRTRAQAEDADARLQAAEAALREAEQAFSGTEQDLDARIRSAEGDVQSAKASEAAARRNLIEAETRIARQDRAHLTAPFSGVVTRILISEGAAQVKQGDSLARLIPGTDSRALEVFVLGRDLPLVELGLPVRVQFEGWPALQVSGLPRAAIGTFGGKVAFIDPDEPVEGRFRVLIEPDPDDPWPDAARLPFGVRAKAWVLLNTVPLFVEWWRAFNDFPPDPVTEDSKKKQDWGRKPGKGIVPK